MQHFDIRKGAWPDKAASALPKTITPVAASSAALVGADMPGLRPRFEVEEGAQVEIGQTLFRDRKHHEVVYVSPIAGRVSTLAYGPRRTLSACVVTADGAERATPMAVALEAECCEAPRATLLNRGFWPAFRTRPFGRTPDPESVPDAIFVNAVQGSPVVPDPVVVLGDQGEAFHVGITLLTKLTEGDVFVCQSPGAPMGPDVSRVQHVSFSGSLAAGLAGTHVDRLCPVANDRMVWTVGYQDVAAIGHLFLTGQYDAQRVIADGAQLVRISLGARLDGISRSGATGFLGRFEEQVLAASKRAANPKATQNALIPTAGLERSLAVDVLPIPLLRALSVGDSEAAERLGCLALVEEDVAALSDRCTSGADYEILLRRVLDELMAEAA